MIAEIEANPWLPPSCPPDGGRLPPGIVAKLKAVGTMREKPMHPMMMEETIRAREEEVSKVAENNRLVALALDGQPGVVSRARMSLRNLFSRAIKETQIPSKLNTREAVEN